MDIEQIKKIQKKHFDEIANQYASRIDAFAYNYYFNFTKNEITKSLKKNSKKDLIECIGLDVGSGNGDLTAAIGRECKTMIGCDVSDEMVRLAKRNHKNVTFCPMPSDSLEFKESNFDFVMSTHLFHHLADAELIERTIAEIKRVAKNNALIAIVDVNKLNPTSNLIQHLMVKRGVDTGKERLVSPHEILSVFKKHGIREVEYRGFCFIPHFFSFARSANSFFDIKGINKLIGKDYVIVGRVYK